MIAVLTAIVYPCINFVCYAVDAAIDFYFIFEMVYAVEGKSIDSI